MTKQFPHNNNQLSQHKQQLPSSNQSIEGQPSNNVKQTAEAQGNIYQSARDLHYQSETSTRSTNVNLWISFFLIGILALGGLAWALNVGLIKESGNPQIPRPNALPTETK